MNEKSLEKNLANLERELVNLQTAHDVGLGAVRFYEFGEFTTSYFMVGDTRVYIVLCEIDEGENLAPMLQCWTDHSTVGFKFLKSAVYPSRFIVYMLQLPEWGDGAGWRLASSSTISYRYAISYQDAEDFFGGGVN